MGTLRYYLHKAKQLFHAPLYLKRQTFVVRYQVMLKNLAGKPNELTLVVPVPQTQGAQRIASEPRFTTAAASLAVEEHAGNKYATWQVVLAPGESRLFTEHFTVSVDPIKRETPSDAFISGYGETSTVFLKPSAHIQADDSQIQSIAKQTTSGASDIRTIVSRLNEQVMKRLEYGNPINGLYKALDALKQVKVDCGGYDSLLVALCIASGIPARVVSGFWAGYSSNTMHAWAEFQLPSGEWIPVDPSTEALAREGRTKKLGGLGVLGSDRIIFSVGCDLPLAINKKRKVVAILQHPHIEASLGERSFHSETRVETTKA